MATTERYWSDCVVLDDSAPRTGDRKEERCTRRRAFDAGDPSGRHRRSQNVPWSSRPLDTEMERDEGRVWELLYHWHGTKIDMSHMTFADVLATIEVSEKNNI